jgi:putative peptidoglycan lipid II flippase
MGVPESSQARLSDPGRETRTPEVGDTEGFVSRESVARSSAIMAAGTFASRVTGMVRTLIQAYALGAAALADAYNVANSLPNAVYNLMLGGILTSVIVPLLVRAARRDADRGAAYTQRTFTLLTLALMVITVIGTAAAGPLIYLYKGGVTGPELHLMIIFAYFFIPQIFFYGVSSLAGAVLNARGSFAAPMWTPVVNNIVVIGVLLAFVFMAGFGVSPSSITPGEVALLGVGTTLGVLAQTAALVPALRAAGFRWRPRYDFRRARVPATWARCSRSSASGYSPTRSSRCSYGCSTHCTTAGRLPSSAPRAWP